ncbi:WD40 repeat-like protein [Multifurca ochricompacta]|uniref:WD40 repeat-like protein n=1 Tax=Multifurca ochricompacta TaxID=376703 RepID=A0AAD4QUM6_9AGAM|nr:WD40 repeat-like protein [Multifurca ochricompacta]
MAAAPITINADEVNCLIYVYLKDSGFQHTAFSLLNEGGLQHSVHLEKNIPRGELIELLIKALLYTEVEAHWRGNNDMTGNCTTGFSLLETHVCSLNPNVKPTVKLSSSNPASAPVIMAPPSASASEHSEATQKRKASTPVAEEGHLDKRQRTAEADSMEVEEKNTDGASTLLLRVKSPKSPAPPIRVSGSGSAPASGPESEDTSDAVRQLKGHEAEVFVCAWNPIHHQVLSSGSKDAVVHLWDLPQTPTIKAKNPKPFQTIDCSSTKVDSDLTSLDWNCHGTLLSVGSYDATLRIYTASAELYFESRLHKGPIFATRFSKDGKWLATASLDNTVCLWDIEKKQRRMQYKHRGICLDLDWLDEELFASCSADKVIHVLSVNHVDPIAVLTGHDGEVNQIKANPSGTRLMSCSDDMTARIWEMRRVKQSSEPDQVTISGEMTVLEGHRNWVTGVSWSPMKIPGEHELVATASFDSTARLWDANTGVCLKVFTHHKKPIYSIAFSPDGRWLATGGGDGWFHLYDTMTQQEREKVWSWLSEHQKRAIFEMSWQQHEGGVDRVALALQSHKVGLIDLTRIPALQKSRTIS